MHDESRVGSGRGSKQRRVIRSGLWIGGVAIALLIGLGVASGASGFFGGRHGRTHDFMGHGSRRAAHVEFAVDWALSKVEATDEQSEQVKTRIAESMTEMQRLHERHRDNRESWMTELSRPTLDRTALENLRVQEMDLAEAASRQFLAAITDVGEILTVEQRIELIELAEDFRGHRRHRLFEPKQD